MLAHTLHLCCHHRQLMCSCHCIPWITAFHVSHVVYISLNSIFKGWILTHSWKRSRELCGCLQLVVHEYTHTPPIANKPHISLSTVYNIGQNMQLCVFSQHKRPSLFHIRDDAFEKGTWQYVGFTASGKCCLSIDLLTIWSMSHDRELTYSENITCILCCSSPSFS